MRAKCLNGSQTGHVRCPAWRNPAKFRQVAADRVDQLSALTHQKVVCAERQPGRLLLLALHRDKPHAWTLRRLADRLRIDRVVLLPLHERFHIGWRDQPHRMTKGRQPPTPMMGASLECCSTPHSGKSMPLGGVHPITQEHPCQRGAVHTGSTVPIGSRPQSHYSGGQPPLAQSDRRPFASVHAAQFF